MTSANSTFLVQLENVCVVIPVFQDADPLQDLLSDLQLGSFRQIVVSYADEPSHDLGDSNEVTYVRSPRGRGSQIAKAIEYTDAEWIWILHADVRVSTNAMRVLCDALIDNDWGAFKVKLTGHSILLNLIGFMMNWRSRITSIYTGDQGMFIRRTLLHRIGGFPALQLMEDIECSSLLRRITRGLQLPETLTVSARKWEREGVVRTILRMWACRLLYYFGASPMHLANRYYR